MIMYAIPSYKRVEKQATVDYLSKCGIQKERIQVFTQTEEEYRKYKDKVKNATIVYAPAKRGVEARNNILNALTEEHDIIMLDDDIKKIGKLCEAGLKTIETAKELDTTFEKCFLYAKKHRTKIFGIYPVYNAFFMSKTISTQVAVNTVFGFAKGFGFRYDENYDTKEDAALCGKILSLHGRVFRFNFLAVDADHRKNKNGYIDDWHQEENIRCVKQLCFNYPQIFAPQSKSPWEVRVLLKDKKINLEKKGGKKQ